MTTDILAALRSSGEAGDLLCLHAAAEIERMRLAIRRLAEQDATLSVQAGNVTVTMDATLTDAEREAVEWAEYVAAQWYEHTASETLRGLLKRMSGNGDCPAPDDAASTPPAASTPTECTVPPEWTSRPYWVDPPSGWRYGFPRLYDPAKDGDMTQWMVANGYPKRLARQGLPCTFTASTEDVGK